MPYTEQEDREKFEPWMCNLRESIKRNIYQKGAQMSKGDLTYLVYALGLEWFRGRKSYTNISTAISCLNDAAAEIRRQHLDPYEDKVKEKNGDVV